MENNEDLSTDVKKMHPSRMYDIFLDSAKAKYKSKCASDHEVIFKISHESYNLNNNGYILLINGGSIFYGNFKSEVKGSICLDNPPVTLGFELINVKTKTIYGFSSLGEYGVDLKTAKQVEVILHKTIKDDELDSYYSVRIQ